MLFLPVYYCSSDERPKAVHSTLTQWKNHYRDLIGWISFVTMASDSKLFSCSEIEFY